MVKNNFSLKKIRYEANLGHAEDFYWGRGEGCEFLERDCRNDAKYEYCKGEYLNCSDDNNFRSRCSVSIFSNSCKLNRHYDSCMSGGNFGNFFESYGPDSICMKAKVNLIRIIMEIVLFVLIMNVVQMEILMKFLKSFHLMKIDFYVKQKGKSLKCLDGGLKSLVKILSIYVSIGSNVLKIVMEEENV